MLWAIWWARRQAIHEQIYQSPVATHQFISRFIEELEVLKPKPIEARLGGNRGVARPKAPPPGVAQIHTDAAMARSHAGGACAAVCRDTEGNFLGSSSLVIHGVTSVASMEALAICEGLALAQDIHLHDIIIASDAKQVVHDIENGADGLYRPIIREISELVSSFNCNITFEGRLANIDADRLAKSSYSLDQGQHVWLLHPHDPFCIPPCVKFDR